MRGIVVIGIEPEIGTTHLCAALALALARRGERVQVFRPVETGCGITRDEERGGVHVDGVPGELDAEARRAYQRLAELVGPPPISVSTKTETDALHPANAARLLELVGDASKSRDLDRVAPLRFSADVAPAMAARLAERPIDVDALRATAEALATDTDALVVDAGSGLLDPLTDDADMATLIENLALPALLVGPSRAGASLVSSLRLHLEALHHRSIPCAGVVLNRLDKHHRPEEAATPFLLDTVAGDVVLGVMPRLDDLRRDDADHLAQRFNVHVDVDRIQAVMTETAATASRG